MDLPNILNNKGPAAAAAAAEQQLQQQLTRAVRPNGRSMSESGSDQDSTPHSHAHQPLIAIPNMVSNAAYQSTPHMQQTMSMLPNPFIPQNGNTENSLAHPQQLDMQQDDIINGSSRPSDSGSSMKAFSCGTCQKGFARRSDLARHGELNH